MPDHQDRAGTEDAQDGLEEMRLVVGVEVGGGFVEEENRTAAEKFAGKGKTETFARGEVSGGFGEKGIEAAGKRADRGVDPGVGQDSEDRFVGGNIGAAEREVGAERGGNEFGKRSEIADPAAKRPDIVIRDGTAVDEDAAGNGLVETEKKREERAFAGAGGTDDEKLRTGFEREVERGQDGAAGMIGKGKVAELDPSMKREIVQAGIEIGLAGGVFELDDAGGGCQGGLGERDSAAKLAEGTENVHEIAVQRPEGTERPFALQNEVDADGGKNALTRQRNEPREEKERIRKSDRAEPEERFAGDAGADGSGNAGFRRVRFHQINAAERGGDHALIACVELADLARNGILAAAELVKQKRIAWKHQKNGGPGARTENEKKNHAARDFQDIGENREEGVREEDLKACNVRIQATGKIAAAKLVEQAGRQIEQAPHDARPERIHDLVNGGIHDALAQKRFGTDQEHQRTRGAEEKPDAVGFTHRERVDEAFLEDRQDIPGCDHKQDAEKYPRVNPAPWTRGGQKKPHEFAKARSLGVLLKLWSGRVQ